MPDANDLPPGSFKTVVELLDGFSYSKSIRRLDAEQDPLRKIAFLRRWIEKYRRALEVDRNATIYVYDGVETLLELERRLDEAVELEDPDPQDNPDSEGVNDLLRPKEFRKIAFQLEKAGLGTLDSTKDVFLWAENLSDLGYLMHCLAGATPPKAILRSNTDFLSVVEKRFRPIDREPWETKAILRTWNLDTVNPAKHEIDSAFSRASKRELRQLLRTIALGP